MITKIPDNFEFNELCPFCFNENTYYQNLYWKYCYNFNDHPDVEFIYSMITKKIIIVYKEYTFGSEKSCTFHIPSSNKDIYDSFISFYENLIFI